MAFLSKSLNETERNYEIHDKEMLAIIRGLEVWRYLLEGVQFKFEIWTDHKNLKYFMKAQKLNRRQARWVLYLSRFDFTLKHVVGSKMGKVDGLSRRANCKVGIDKDNNDQILIKDNWIRNMYEVVVEGPEVDMSDYATGGVLSMEYEDGLWRPVAFLFKSLNETERNYEIHDKEMLLAFTVHLHTPLIVLPPSHSLMHPPPSSFFCQYLELPILAP